MISNAEILNAKILIVDDLVANVRLLEQMLRGAGYTNVMSTMNSLEVSTLHLENKFDLILLDLQMPGMDGFEVLAALKTIETDGYVPVLVVTAQPGHKLRALAAGAKDFVSKPFDLVEVTTRIRNLLEVRLLYKQVANHNKLLEKTVFERTAELRASEARFQRFAELSSDWYWEQDASGQFIQLSGRALEMLGVPEDSTLDPSNSHNARWNKVERAVLDAKIAARQPFLDFVYSRMNEDGSHQHFQMSGEPIFDASGGYRGYRGIGMDITSRSGF
jgi:PAS domain S-box-containing protein